MKSLCYPCDTTDVIREPIEASSKTIREFVQFRDNKGQALVEKMRSNVPKGISVSDFHRGTSIKEERDLSFEKKYEWELEPSIKSENKIPQLNIGKD